MRKTRIAIIGTGVAAHCASVKQAIAHDTSRTLESVPIERVPTPFRGLAYGTRLPDHIVNMPANTLQPPRALRFL